MIFYNANKSISKDLTYVIFITLFFTVIFILFLREPIASDDCSYFEMASRMFDHMGYIYQHSDRNGIILSIKLSQVVFGYTDLAYYSVPFFYGLGYLLGIYYLGAFFFSRVVGFLSSIVMGTASIFTMIVTIVLPDIPSTFWFLLGLNFYVRSFNDNAMVGRNYYYALCAAVSVFIAFWTKETAGVLALSLPAFLLITSYKYKVRILSFVIGIGIVLFLISMIWNYFVYDDALLKLHKYTQKVIPGHNELWIDLGIIKNDYTWSKLLLRYPELFLFTKAFTQKAIYGLNYYNILFYSFALTAILVVLSDFVVWIKRKHGEFCSVTGKKRLFSLFLLAQIFIPFLFYTLLVTSIDPLIPIIREKARYFIPIMTFMPLFIFGTLHNIKNHPRIRGVAEKYIRIARKITILSVVMASFLIIFIDLISNGNLVLRDGNLLHKTRHIVSELEKRNFHVGLIYQDKVSRINRLIKIFFENRQAYIFNDNVNINLGDIYISKDWPPEAENNSEIIWQDFEGGSFRGIMHNIYYVSDNKEAAEVLNFLNDSRERKFFNVKSAKLLEYKPGDKFKSDTSKYLLHAELNFYVRNRNPKKAYLKIFESGAEEPIIEELTISKFEEKNYGIIKSINNIKLNNIDRIRVEVTFWNPADIIVKQSEMHFSNAYSKIILPEYNYLGLSKTISKLNKYFNDLYKEIH